MLIDAVFYVLLPTLSLSRKKFAYVSLNLEYGIFLDQVEYHFLFMRRHSVLY